MSLHLLRYWKGNKHVWRQVRGEKEAVDLSIPWFITGNVRLQVNKLDKLAVYTQDIRRIGSAAYFCFMRTLLNRNIQDCYSGNRGLFCSHKSGKRAKTGGILTNVKTNCSMDTERLARRQTMILSLTPCSWLFSLWIIDLEISIILNLAWHIRGTYVIQLN